MKKLLQTLGAVLVAGTTSTTVVACKPNANQSIELSDLPDVTNIKINDTLANIEVKILSSWLESDIYISSLAYDLLLEVDQQLVEFPTDFVAKNGDVFWIKIKDIDKYPYHDKKIVVDDQRANLGDFKMTFNQKIKVDQLKSAVRYFLEENLEVELIPSDYLIYINGRDVTFQSVDAYISERDDIQIKAWQLSETIYGELIPEVSFKKLALVDVMKTAFDSITQHNNYQKIKRTLDNLVPYWEDDLTFSITRNGTTVALDENYITSPQDVIQVSALEISEWYLGKTSKTIVKETYDDFFAGEISLPAGTLMSDFTPNLVVKIKDRLRGKGKDYSVNPNNVKVDINQTQTELLTKTTTATVTLNDEFFTKPLVLKVLGADISNLSLFKPAWKDYQTFVSDLDAFLKADSTLKYLDVKKDLFITDYAGKVLDESFVPKANDKTLIIIKGQTNSQYTDITNSYASFYL